MHVGLIMLAYIATCLCISVSAYSSLYLLILLMHAYVCLSICSWVMISVKEISVGTM
jgi:hypothetical protein